MIFGTADVLNSASFDLIFVSQRSHRRQPLTRLTYGLLSIAKIGVELEKKFATFIVD